MRRSSGDRSQRPIVAELGRPETPEETAARKAEASRNHRANQTMVNLVGALAVCLLVVLALVLVVVRPGPEPRKPIDYATVAEEAQPGLETELVVPILTDEWAANSAQLERSGGVTSWYIGLITPKEQFIGLRQGIDANDTWLAGQLGFFQPDGTVTIDGVSWQVYDNRDARDNPGNRAYVMAAEHGTSTVVLAGTAVPEEFDTLAATVSAKLTEGDK